jgi:hypothetical protein
MYQGRTSEQLLNHQYNSNTSDQIWTSDLKMTEMSINKNTAIFFMFGYLDVYRLLIPTKTAPNHPVSVDFLHMPFLGIRNLKLLILRLNV